LSTLANFALSLLRKSRGLLPATTEFGIPLGLYGLGAALNVVPPGKTASRFRRPDVVEYVDSGRIRVDVGATGRHREGATFGSGRPTPLGYWEGEDIGDGSHDEADGELPAQVSCRLN